MQEMGRCNRPPYLKNRFFPKLVHFALGVLGVTDPVPIELGEFYVRDGWIPKNRIDQQGGTEVSPLLAQPLMSRIFSSSSSHGFLRSFDITQERSSGGEGDIYHGTCGCGYATYI